VTFLSFELIGNNSRKLVRIGQACRELKFRCIDCWISWADLEEILVLSGSVNELAIVELHQQVAMVMRPVSILFFFHSQDCKAFAGWSLVNKEVRVFSHVCIWIFSIWETCCAITLPLAFDQNALPSLRLGVVSTDVNFVKFFAEVGEVHPEDSVLNQLFDSAYVLDSWGPKLWLVRPVAIPLSASPWISQTNEFVVIYLDELENTVSMSLHDSSVWFRSVSVFMGRRTSSKQHTFFLKENHFLPDRLLIGGVINGNSFWDSVSELWQRKMG